MKNYQCDCEYAIFPFGNGIPIKLTIEDIVKMITEAEKMGVAINMQFIPIKKDKDRPTEKGGVEE